MGETGRQVVPQVHVASHNMGSTGENRPRAADPGPGWDITGYPWGGGALHHTLNSSFANSQWYMVNRPFMEHAVWCSEIGRWQVDLETAQPKPS